MSKEAIQIVIWVLAIASILNIFNYFYQMIRIANDVYGDEE